MIRICGNFYCTETVFSCILNTFVIMNLQFNLLGSEGVLGGLRVFLGSEGVLGV